MERQAKMNRPHGCLVTLATGLLGALIGAAIGWATYDPCVSDEFFCLYDEPWLNTFEGGFVGLLIGTFAGLVLLQVWGPRVPRDESRVP